ncbi:IS66 family insertion sequence element accessory protein TnpB [Pseudomonas sp. MPC6]|uniref:IS66 family insertion sequence element accessory protein TnpB n=1 Tax=unclassified Pseudomonas TaxID=196821 RepID=UPI001E2B301E|nr:IS66 family insertion sequence element accessory protein TnpB [Pseudomonas sp. MPC6]
MLEPMDMRLDIDGLSARIQHALGRSPCDGTAYAFRNRRGNWLKFLQWDGTGVWLSQRRLHEGAFVIGVPIEGDRLDLRCSDSIKLRGQVERSTSGQTKGGLVVLGTMRDGRVGVDSDFATVSGGDSMRVSKTTTFGP